MNALKQNVCEAATKIFQYNCYHFEKQSLQKTQEDLQKVFILKIIALR